MQQQTQIEVTENAMKDLKKKVDELQVHVNAYSGTGPSLIWTPLGQEMCPD